MTDGYDTAYHEDRQGRVRAVLIATEAELRPENVALIDELIDANEYGIALETLTELLAAENVPIGRDLYKDIRSLVATMGLPPDVWDRLAPNVTAEG